MDLCLRHHTIRTRILKLAKLVCQRSIGTIKDQVNKELLNKFNQDISAGGIVPVFRRALLFPKRIAVQDEVGIYSYAALHHAAATFSKQISSKLDGKTDHTIAYLCGNDASHVIVQWAVWMTGNIAVPLSTLHPPDLLKYYITDCDASLVVSSVENEQVMSTLASELSKPLVVLERNENMSQDNENKQEVIDLIDVGHTNSYYGKSDAMLIYTSGTTSKPKGVVWTHRMLLSQISSLHAAWRYAANDVVLHILPLHHIHGQLNSLNASLAAGARVRMSTSAATQVLWARLSAGARAGVLHAVPAVYARLAAAHAALRAREQRRLRAALADRVRLMCCGSAPLTETLFWKWEEISGSRLLERYGMTEVGMALSNPYRNSAERTPGCVGTPLPGVSARIASPNSTNTDLEPLITVETPPVDDRISMTLLGYPSESPGDDELEGYEWRKPEVTVHRESEDGVYQGELLLKGSGVFTRYWNRPTPPADFTKDGWFRTGDTVSYQDGKFKILGRSSIDIIKTSGYKVSALQVESAILEHPDVSDAAVIGVGHEVYGEIVIALVVTKEGKDLTLQELKTVVGKKLAPYQLPRKLIVIDRMPRNVMGKLDKKEIKREFGEKLTSKKS